MARGVFVHGMDREAKAYCLAGSFLGSGEFCLTSATFGGSDDELPVLERRGGRVWIGLGREAPRPPRFSGRGFTGGQLVSWKPLWVKIDVNPETLRAS